MKVPATGLWERQRLGFDPINISEALFEMSENSFPLSLTNLTVSFAKARSSLSYVKHGLNLSFHDRKGMIA